MKFAKKIMATCLAAMMTVSCIPNVYAVAPPAEEPKEPLNNSQQSDLSSDILKC